VLRGVEGPGRYGLRNLTVKQSERLRNDNLLALRSCMAVDAMARLNSIGILEQPALRKGEVSMLLLDEFVALLRRPNVKHWIGAQCPFGANAAKLTSFISTGVSLDEFVASCQHVLRAWFPAGGGPRIYARHPPSRGTTRYFSTEEEAGANRQSDDKFVSTCLSAYPPLLNRYLAVKIQLAVASNPLPCTGSAPVAAQTGQGICQI
jgi:hypothetical protein